MCADDYDTVDDYFAKGTYSQVEEDFSSGVCLYQDHLLALTTRVPDAFDPSELDRAKLPPVVLPSFSGEIQEWVHFKDTFPQVGVRGFDGHVTTRLFSQILALKPMTASQRMRLIEFVRIRKIFYKHLKHCVVPLELRITSPSS